MCAGSSGRDEKDRSADAWRAISEKVIKNIPHNAHVLVVDGRKCLLFRNEGGVAKPDLTLSSHSEQVSEATRDQGTGEPGKTYASLGEARSGYEQTNFHQLDEDRFAVEAAEMLKREVLAGRIDTLIVVAAPRTPGELRKHCHAEVQKRMIGEISKDVVGRPANEMRFSSRADDPLRRISCSKA